MTRNRIYPWRFQGWIGWGAMIRIVIEIGIGTELEPEPELELEQLEPGRGG